MIGEALLSSRSVPLRHGLGYRCPSRGRRPDGEAELQTPSDGRSSSRAPMHNPVRGTSRAARRRRADLLAGWLRRRLPVLCDRELVRFVILRMLECSSTRCGFRAVMRPRGGASSIVSHGHGRAAAVPRPRPGRPRPGSNESTAVRSGGAANHRRRPGSCGPAAQRRSAGVHARRGPRSIPARDAPRDVLVLLGPTEWPAAVVAGASIDARATCSTGE